MMMCHELIFLFWKNKSDSTYPAVSSYCQRSAGGIGSKTRKDKIVCVILTTAKTICRGGPKCIFRSGPRNHPCFSQLKIPICRGGYKGRPCKYIIRAGGGSPAPTNDFLEAGDRPTRPWKWINRGGWVCHPPLENHLQGRVITPKNLFPYIQKIV